jgi:hypothetical protein
MLDQKPVNCIFIHIKWDAKRKLINYIIHVSYLKSLLSMFEE